MYNNNGSSNYSPLFGNLKLIDEFIHSDHNTAIKKEINFELYYERYYLIFLITFPNFMGFN